MAFGLQTFNEFGDATFDSTENIAHLSEFVVKVGGYRSSSPLQTIQIPPDVPKNLPVSNLFVGVDKYFEYSYGSVGYTQSAYGNLPIKVQSVQEDTLTIMHSFVPGTRWQNKSYIEEQEIRIGWVLPL